jgi:hypothetical protein
VVTVVLSGWPPVVVTKPTLEPAELLLTVSVVVVAVLEAPDLLLDSATAEPRLARASFKPAIPEASMIPPQNVMTRLRLRVKSLSNRSGGVHRIARTRRRFAAAKMSWPELATETAGAG